MNDITIYHIIYYYYILYMNDIYYYPYIVKNSEKIESDTNIQIWHDEDTNTELINECYMATGIM